MEVAFYFHGFHQKPTTLDGDGKVISAAHLMSEQWHVSVISVKYREKYLKRFNNVALLHTHKARTYKIRLLDVANECE